LWGGGCSFRWLRLCACWVSELRGGSGWFGVSIRADGFGDLRDFLGEFWAGGGAD